MKTFLKPIGAEGGKINALLFAATTPQSLWVFYFYEVSDCTRKKATI
jgi:hypothetical protein